MIPTPPPLTNDDPEVWNDYVMRVLAFVADEVERTETRGLRCTVQVEIPNDHRVACTAFFCYDCSALHIKSEFFDENAELTLEQDYDPAHVRERAREIEEAR